tara:strand:- start:135601 stop:135774 length:174 start_codon:yes stop_codon:yes gene_type:complete
MFILQFIIAFIASIGGAVLTLYKVGAVIAVTLQVVYICGMVSRKISKYFENRNSKLA